MGGTNTATGLILSSTSEEDRIRWAHATSSRQSNPDERTHEDDFFKLQAFNKKASVLSPRSHASTHLQGHNRPNFASEREAEPTTFYLRPRHICSRADTRPKHCEVVVSRWSRISYFLQDGHFTRPADIQIRKDVAPESRSNTQQGYKRGFDKSGMADCAKEPVRHFEIASIRLLGIVTWGVAATCCHVHHARDSRGLQDTTASTTRITET